MVENERVTDFVEIGLEPIVAFTAYQFLWGTIDVLSDVYQNLRRC